MISYNIEDQKFNFRVAGLALHDGKVLLHQYESFDFWALPGGRAEMGEDSIETIKREFEEELGESISVDRLLWCCESFYDHRGFKVHELCLYYLVEFLDDSKVIQKTEAFDVKEIDGSTLTFKWFDIKSIDALEFYPKFIQTSLEQLPQTTQHVIDREL